MRRAARTTATRTATSEASAPDAGRGRMAKMERMDSGLVVMTAMVCLAALCFSAINMLEAHYSRPLPLPKMPPSCARMLYSATCDPVRS